MTAELFVLLCALGVAAAGLALAGLLHHLSGVYGKAGYWGAARFLEGLIAVPVVAVVLVAFAAVVMLGRALYVGLGLGGS